MTRNLISLSGAASAFVAAAMTLDEKLDLVLPHIGQIAVDHSKSLIGQDEVSGKGGFETWKPLADATIEDKEKKGYDTPRSLLREGDLRDSIKYVVEKEHHSVTIGSESEVAVAQELGTDKIPPRSFLGIGAEMTKEELKKMVLDAAITMFKR